MLRSRIRQDRELDDVCYVQKKNEILMSDLSGFVKLWVFCCECGAQTRRPSRGTTPLDKLPVPKCRCLGEHKYQIAAFDLRLWMKYGGRLMSKHLSVLEMAKIEGMI